MAKHLEDTAPVAKLFRPIRKQMASIAGKYSGSTHTNPDRSLNILKIRMKIEEACIYKVNLKRNNVERTKNILLVSAYMQYPAY